nr:GH32 C-terminal domain-containing protein [Actinomyces sp.]
MTEDLRAAEAEAVAGSHAASDPDYPLIHVAPPVGRLNDPNGLLIDDGVAHVFFQYTPAHPSRRLVYWGHASSEDLLHWTHHAPAIVPDSFYDASGAYSGNALVLEDGERERAPHAARYQLFYTGNLKDDVGERTASQCLVTSTDLVSFTKWPGNPLIPTHAAGYTAHFRDPQVTRDPDHPGRFRMLLGVQRQDLSGAALVYHSTDLLSWQLDGELSFPDAHGALDHLGYMWECPGVVRLTEETTGQVRDVLIWCPQGADQQQADGYENVFPCVYAVGHLVGTRLLDSDGTLRQVDHGFEFYTPQAFSRAPSQPGQVLLTGWAGNAGQDDQPSATDGGWVHTLTVPRALSLRHGRLVQRPVLPEPQEQAQLPARVAQAAGEPVTLLEGHRSWHLVLEAERAAGALQVRIGSEESHVSIELDLSRRTLRVDRSSSRYTAHGTTRTVSLDEHLAPRLEVLHDRSVTEVFVGDGDLAFTLRSFVDPAADGVWLRAPGASLKAASASVFD